MTFFPADSRPTCAAQSVESVDGNPSTLSSFKVARASSGIRSGDGLKVVDFRLLVKHGKVEFDNLELAIVHWDFAKGITKPESPSSPGYGEG